jgi:hypothetical protein
MAEAKSVPLNIKKDLKDKQPKFDELIKKIETSLGITGVTFAVNAEDNYNLLADNKQQSKFADAVLAYFTAAQTGIEGITKAASLAKDDFNKAFTSKTVSLKILPHEEYKVLQTQPDFGGNTHGGCSFNKNGDLQISTWNGGAKVGGWWGNVHEISNYKLFVRTVRNDSTKELPLVHKIALATVIQPKIDEQIKKLRALEGLSDANFQCDWLSAYKVFLAESKDHDPDSVKLVPAVDYLLRTVENFEKKLWKDSMVREAILEKWKAPHNIILLPSCDLKAQTGNVVKTTCTGLKIEGGDFFILAQAGKWWANVNELASLDLTKGL